MSISSGKACDHEVHERPEEIHSYTHFQELVDMGESTERCGLPRVQLVGRRRGMNIYKEIGEAAILEMLAEECAELAQAALKLARIQRGENPSRATEEEERGALICEIADVENALAQLSQASWLDPEEIGEVMDIKTDRWRKSILEANEEKEKKRGYQI